jgi:serine/threonine protein kinase
MALPDPHHRPTRPGDAEAASFPTLAELALLLPQYEMQKVIGVGGMGAIYKARHRGLGRDVAIKVLPQEASDRPEEIERFIKEARAMAKLKHPNIATVFDFGQTVQRHLYLVMEFVDGLDLHRRIRFRELDQEKIGSIVNQLCDALQFAHAQGVVHRDIKPANILISTDWRVKVVDFGLARELTVQTSDGEVEYGTPDYTSPERLIIGASVDHRADIFALGVLIHEMFTGRTTAAALPDDRELLPPGVSRIITRCVAHDPEQRYASVHEVKFALLHPTPTARTVIKTGAVNSTQASPSGWWSRLRVWWAARGRR